MTDFIQYTLDDGDLLLVPASAKVRRYSPVEEDEGTTISADDLPKNGGPTRQKRTRTQRHPRTPKKYWARQKLVAQHGLVDAAKLEGVSPQTLSAMAARYHWKFPRYKRAELNGVSDG